jgi:hypothetical protein
LAVVNISSNNASSLLNDGALPATPSGGSSPPTHHARRIVPAFVTSLPSQPNLLIGAPAPHQSVEPGQSPALATSDEMWTGASTNDFAPVRPLLLQSPATALDFLAEDLAWMNWPAWLA